MLDVDVLLLTEKEREERRTGLDGEGKGRKGRTDTLEGRYKGTGEEENGKYVPTKNNGETLCKPILFGGNFPSGTKRSAQWQKERLEF